MIWISRLAMFSIALDAILRMLPRLFLAALYCIGVIGVIIVSNEGYRGFQYLMSHPILAIKYVWGYLKWLYYNQDSLNLKIVIKCIFALFFPYLFYRLSLAFIGWMTDKVVCICSAVAKIVTEKFMKITMLDKVFPQKKSADRGKLAEYFSARKSSRINRLDKK